MTEQTERRTDLSELRVMLVDLQRTVERCVATIDRRRGIAHSCPRCGAAVVTVDVAEQCPRCGGEV